MPGDKGKDTTPEHAPFHLIGPFAGGSWTISECDAKDAYVAAPRRVAAVPKFVTSEDLWTQGHELGHVKRAQRGVDLTWAGYDSFSIEYRKMLEEIAVDCDETRRGLDVRRRHDGYDWRTMEAPKERIAASIMFLQLVNSTPVTRNPDLQRYFQDLGATLSEADVNVLMDAWRRTVADTSDANCRKLTAELVSHFAPKVETPKPRSETKEKKEAKEKVEKAEKAEAERREKEERKSSSPNAEHKDVDPTKGDKTLEKTEREKPAESSYVPHGMDTGYGGGLLDVHRHTLSRQGARCRGNVWRPTDAGGPLRYPAQLHTRKVYARKAAGGTILVDGSGSMGAIGDTLERLIVEFPAAWVAFYSAHRDRCENDNRCRYTGRLCIVAENGRLGDADFRSEKEHTGGNYGSDPLALAYILKAKEATPPYIWVSDGLVGHPWIKDTVALMKRGQIVRVNTIQDALAYLQGKKRDEKGAPIKVFTDVPGTQGTFR